MIEPNHDVLSVFHSSIQEGDVKKKKYNYWEEGGENEKWETPSSLPVEKKLKYFSFWTREDENKKLWKVARTESF